jgi:hypothetical protein
MPNAIRPNAGPNAGPQNVALDEVKARLDLYFEYYYYYHYKNTIFTQKVIFAASFYGVSLVCLH